MLKSLLINNIVLIEKAEILFGKGLCVLSGETGSGKSILLDALGLAIGFRSNIRLIGNDENKAQVSAEFDISKNIFCQKILKENELFDSENPNQLRIRRLLQENSSSKVFVNDIAVGVNLLAKIGETLIEIHGQHDQRGLLNPSSHLTILDEFAQNESLLNELKISYVKFREIEEKIIEFEQKREAAIREKDYLEHVVKELESAKVEFGEEEILVQKKQQLSSREKFLKVMSEAESHLLEANSQMILAQKILIKNAALLENYFASDENNVNEILTKLDQNNNDLDSAISSIQSQIRKVNYADETIEEIEERLFFIRALARKFDVKCDELQQVKEQSQDKLKTLNHQEEIQHGLEKEKNLALQKYKKLAQEISSKRSEAAKILSAKVEEELKFLKMEGVKFLVEVNSSQENQVSANGQDRVIFKASINKNDFDEISKIASGGELSRFMLSLKVALMDVKSVPTMIFDEIDTGIGGSTAEAVGKRLKILAKTSQILVVTHQPQIAAKADQHFKISKISHDNKIKTSISELENSQRIEEVARMLSGEQISAEAIAAAKKLF